MNLIILSYIILYFVYAAVNLYTDIRYRKTMNNWHLIFFSFSSLMLIFDVSIKSWFLVLTLSIALGLFLEKILKCSSPGDTKMIAVTSIWLADVSTQSPYLIPFVITACHLLYFILFSLVILVKKKGLVGAMKNQLNQIYSYITPGLKPSKEIIIKNFPGAVTIFLGMLTYVGFFIIKGEIPI